MLLLQFAQVSAEDELPQKMCLNCISEMNHAFAFKQKCQRSERTLQTYLEQLKVTANETHKNPFIFDEYKIPVDIEMEVDKIHTESLSYLRKMVECQTNDPDTSQKSDSLGEITLKVENNKNGGCSQQQEIEVSTEIPIKYIQITENPKFLVIKSESKHNAAQEAVQDFIAENTLNFVCNNCKASFSSRRSLKLHMNSRKCMQQSYECDSCHKIFIKKRYLIRHFHRMKRETNPSDCRAVDTKIDNRRKYKCHLCAKGRKLSRNA